MLEERAAYALNLILNAIKEEMVRGSWEILTNNKRKLKEANLSKAIKEEMNQYFCDIDRILSP